VMDRLEVAGARPSSVVTATEVGEREGGED
jgi:hypothetical protein